MVTMRLARRTDAPQLKQLNDLFNGEGCNTLAAVAESLGSNSQELVCVAEDGETLAGFCCAQVFQSMCYSVKYAEITELFVLELYRRRGVASGLMALAEAEFQKQGIHHFQLFTGKTNEAAQAFYRARGYVASSEMMFRKRPAGE